MADLIRRREAIEAIRALYPGMPRVKNRITEWSNKYEQYLKAEYVILNLDMVRFPLQWIPCSERLPEKKTGIL